MPDPVNNADVFDERVVGKLWHRMEHRPRGCLPLKTFFPQALPVFMKCLLSAFMLRDRFFCLAASESFPLCGREARIGALRVTVHFPFVFSIWLQPARNR